MINAEETGAARTRDTNERGFDGEGVDVRVQNRKTTSFRKQRRDRSKASVRPYNRRGEGPTNQRFVRLATEEKRKRGRNRPIFTRIGPANVPISNPCPPRARLADFLVAARTLSSMRRSTSRYRRTCHSSGTQPYASYTDCIRHDPTRGRSS